jgi:hypothetical protein
MAIDSVYQTGDDALGNMAELEITGFSLFGPLAAALKFRTTQIAVPGFTMGVYEVHWKSQKFEKPSGKDETEKTFSFTFRVDKYYTVYKALLAWWQYICNSDSGAMAEDVGAVTTPPASNIRTDVFVKTRDTQETITNEGFKFTGAWIKSLAGFSYDVASGDPLTCEVTMSFVKMIPIF